MAVVVPIETKYNPRGVKVAIRNLDDFKTAVDKAGGGMRGFATVTGKVMESVGRSISTTGQSMTRNVTLPIVGVGIAAGIAFNDVDEALDTVAARSGRTGDELARLQDVTKNVASNATQDFATVGEVVGQLGGRFTASASTIETFAGKMLTLSRVTGTDATTATESISTAMKALGIPVKSAGGFLDTLLVASQKSGVSIDALAATTAKAAPSFRTYGIDANEAVGLIAAMEGAGIPTTRVVAGLNSAFKKFAEEGVKDIPGALDETLRRIRDMPSDTAATSLAVETFGSRVGVTLADSLRTGKINLDDLSGALQNSSGALTTTAAAVEGPQEQFARLKNQIMLVAAEFFEALLPALQAILPYVQQAIDWFKGLDESQQKLAVIIAVVVAAMGPLLIVIGSLITAVGGFITVIGAISAPVLAVVAAIGLIVAAVVLLWNKSEAFRTAVLTVWNSIKAAVQQAVDGIKRKLDENKDKIDAFKEALAVVWEFIQQYVIPAIAEFYRVYLTTLIKIVGFVIEKIIDWYSFLWDVGAALVEVGKKVWNFVGAVRDGLGDAIAFITELPGKVLNALGNAGTWLVDTGKDMIQGLIDGAGSLLSNIGQFFLDKLPWWIVEPFKKALGIASPSKVFEGFGKNIGDGLIRGSDGKRTAVESASKRLGDAMKRGAKGALQSAIDSATDVKGGLEERLGKLRDYFSRLRDMVVQAFADLKSRAQEQVDELAGRLQSLRDEAKAFRDAFRSALSVSFTVDASGAKSPLEAFRKGVQDAYAFAGAIKNLRNLGLNETSLQSIISAGVDQGNKIAESLLREGPGAINEVNSLVAMLDSQVSSVAQTLSDDKFAAKIAEADAALRQAQDSYNAIAAREREQLAHIDALGKQFGISSDAMTVTLDGAQTRLEAMLASQTDGVDALATGVGEVTTGLLETATKMATQAAALQRNIDSLTAKINAAQTKLDGKDGKNNPGKAIGGPVMAGKAYMVGEMGPETFVPSVSGSILTARETRNLGGVTIAPGAVQVVVNGGNAAQVEAVVKAAFEELVRELQRA